MSDPMNRPEGTPSRRPLLSILIPTYDYPEGVVRILRCLTPRLQDDVEIIISDDSPTSAVAESVAPFLDACDKIKYTHNARALGPCANWNALLERAAGEYCLLLHHDDIPA